MYDVASTYLRTKVADTSKCLNVGKTVRQERPTFDIVPGAEVIDSFQGITGLKWKSHIEKGFEGYERLRYFTLSFDKKLKEVVLESYLADVISRSKAIQEAERVVKLYSRDLGRGSPGRGWSSIVLEHPTTFEKLAMDPVQKRMLKDDLDKFVNRSGIRKLASSRPVQVPTGTDKTGLRQTDLTASQAHRRCPTQWSAVI
ncbi:hypothetical protein SO802_029515 [Lithocarpus litseifolius]|uniref:AAA-type ATPase N-terminal domain-containing protein n=1 Tax=Lithocarpus litseifolius TaxID=425828 RepID=A0AAW2BVC8_9ROSI